MLDRLTAYTRSENRFIRAISVRALGRLENPTLASALEELLSTVSRRFPAMLTPGGSACASTWSTGSESEAPAAAAAPTKAAREVEPAEGAEAKKARLQ